MTIAEAKKEIAKLAGDRYCAVEHSWNRYSEGGWAKEYRVYISGVGWGYGKSWDGAIENMKERAGE